ncbi:MAG TPA: helix-turn-helix transcriptional regulator [Rhizomicrobium sp.]|jgi:DNA-binding CsgD family transcriptional regulator
MSEAVAVGWLERADVPLFLFTEDLRLVWKNMSATILMNKLLLRVDAFGTIRSSRRDMELKERAGRQQLRAAIANRRSWKGGTTGLTLGDFPGARLHLYEMTVNGSVLIGCAVMVEDGAAQDMAARLAKYGLTRTEGKVISMLAGGATAGEIARINGSSLLTVRTHIKRAYEKMEVNSREKLFARLMGRNPIKAFGGMALSL